MKLVAIPADGSLALEGATGHDALADMVTASVDLYLRRGFVAPWICYVAIEGDAVVGSCGFAAPASAGEAEIAYFSFPGHEGKGVATRMATTLMALSQDAAREQGVRLIAHTLPAEGASTSILRKLGFELLGAIQHNEDGEVWKWRRAAHGQ
jgi:[ribosomal protein S5]-alanine N-acetyltransferase